MNILIQIEFLIDDDSNISLIYERFNFLLKRISIYEQNIIKRARQGTRALLKFLNNLKRITVENTALLRYQIVVIILSYCAC